ncbi:LytR/AlgR family response regulator transcription factor [Filimonas effusa]|uniref:LytR/AlgR family response regulator transcription factor n=1 Tax=Filimonas effusa TaxID=2508721 RepID=UPI001C70A233|nr:hypothetical protein [Filimonas effusa]
MKKLLADIHADIDVIATLDTVAGSVTWFQQHPHPDVVLMYIRIADGLSFDIFQKVNLLCPVIFTTAYDEYAVRAFKVNSLDYLLKPVEREQALDKVKANSMQPNTTLLMHQLLELLNHKQATYRTRFMIPFRDGYKTVLAADVDFYLLCLHHSPSGIKRW